MPYPDYEALTVDQEKSPTGINQARGQGISAFIHSKMADSPGSPLSSHASSEFTEDVKLEDGPDYDDLHMPPAKKLRMGHTSFRSTPQSQSEDLQDDTDISSDTSGDGPSSPTVGPTFADDDLEQVTACRWRSCAAGDLGNMDELVKHIHDAHIGQRQKKYACEWEGCSRIDAQHASGYALRAHMRSHTREKPFYCQLPECDKAFTRSDALAKHMRTVHETEALRPSDPIPRNHSQAQVKPQRIKLIVNARPPGDGDVEPNDVSAGTEGHAVSAFEYPAELGFSEEERVMPPDQLFRLCRRQVRWSEQESERLKKDVEELERKRKREWQAKELVLANTMEAELAVAHAMGADHGKITKMMQEFLPDIMLPMTGPTPWFRKPRTDQAEP